LFIPFGFMGWIAPINSHFISLDSIGFHFSPLDFHTSPFPEPECISGMYFWWPEIGGNVFLVARNPTGIQLQVFLVARESTRNQLHASHVFLVARNPTGIRLHVFLVARNPTEFQLSLAMGIDKKSNRIQLNMYFWWPGIQLNLFLAMGMD